MVSIDDVQKKLTAYFDDRLIGQPELVEGIVTNIKLREIYHNNLAFAKETGIYIPPLNMLVRGKSGNGKSHSINFICRSLGLPFVSVNATDFTSSGYVGASLSDIPKMLIDEAERILKEKDQIKGGFDVPPPTQDDKDIEEADNRFKAIEKAAYAAYRNQDYKKDRKYYEQILPNRAEDIAANQYYEWTCKHLETKGKIDKN